LKKKKLMHRIDLSHVAPHPAFVDAPHVDYIGTDNMFIDTLTR
jgi:hypothetical protein